MLIPYSAALRLGKVPWVTLTVIVLCVFIYWKEEKNAARIDQHVRGFCQGYPDLSESIFAHADRGLAVTRCNKWLSLLHSRPDPDAFLGRLRITPRWIPKGVETDTFVDNLDRLYQHFLQSGPPWSLDAALMYDPLGWNPLRMITSSLAHADRSHLIGNLIFFIAFAPAVELLVGGALRYTGILLATAAAASIAYSVTVLLGAEPLPGLGLSGVVMGMIGLSAFMMPNARIKMFYWLGFAVGTLYIPAWILAMWYIGMDTWRVLSSADVGNVNVIAHVAGGVAGYFVGVFFLRKQRELNKDELDEELWHQKWKRYDSRFNRFSSYRKQPETYANEDRLKQAREDYQSFTDRLFRAVRLRNNSEAVQILLEYYDLYQNSPETYEELFHDIKDYGSSRAVQCAGRLVISLYLRQGKTAAALRVLEECVGLSAHFSLSSITEAGELFKCALSCDKKEVARQIVSNAQWKYGARHGAALRKWARQSR